MCTTTIPLYNVSWRPIQDRAFRKLQDMLLNAVKMSHPKENHFACVFTDVSENFCAGVVTQTNRDQCHKHIDELQHAPLVFLDGILFRFSETPDDERERSMRNCQGI